MKRTINFTGRETIQRGDIRLALFGPEDGPRRFDLQIDLAEYDLPSDARIFFEASRGATWMRFDCGTVGAFTPPDAQGRTLRDLGSAQGASFRIKVVEASSRVDGPAARILAQADRIRPDTTGADGPARSMLEIDWAPEGELGEELWRLELTSCALLRINKSIVQHDGTPRSWRDVTASPAFRAFAMPSIFREVLRHILRTNADDPTSGDLGVWIKFASDLLGCGAPPPPPEESGSLTEDQEAWIDRAVASFCSRRNIRQCTILAMGEEGSAA